MEGVNYIVCKDKVITSKEFDSDLKRKEFIKQQKRFNQRKTADCFITSDPFKFHYFNRKPSLEFQVYYKLDAKFLLDRSLAAFIKLHTLREIDKLTFEMYKDSVVFQREIPFESENLVIVRIVDGMPAVTRLVTPRDIDYLEEGFLTNRICSLIESNKLGMDKLISSLKGEEYSDIRDDLYRLRDDQYIYELFLREGKIFDTQTFFSKIRDMVKRLFTDKNGNHMYDRVRAVALCISDFDKRLELKRIEEEKKNPHPKINSELYNGEQIGMFDQDKPKR
jgi:hypothetical protein